MKLEKKRIPLFWSHMPVLKRLVTLQICIAITFSLIVTTIAAYVMNEKAIAIANSRKVDILRLMSANQEKIRLWAKLDMEEALKISISEIKKITSVNDVNILNLTPDEFQVLKNKKFKLLIPEAVDDKLPYYFVFGLGDVSKPTLSATLIIPLIIFIFIFILLYSSIHFIIEKVFRPLSEMISFDISPKTSNNLLNIEADGEIKLILEKIRDSQQEKIKTEAEISNIKLATQLAHDIRSPLEALKSLKEEMSSLPEQSRKRVQLIINRIEEITYKLLKTYKNSSASNKPNSEELLSLVSSVMIEKQIEYRSNTIKLKEDFDSNAYGLFSKISRNTLKCILSNLINNGIESSTENGGEVVVSLSSKDDMNIIRVSDNGAGIPAHIKDNLFTKGFTTKKDGNGLGLYSARNEIEEVGGKIEFTSVPGMGTEFVISLPKSERPESFLKDIDISKYESIIILDDDPSFHEVWLKKLNGCGKAIEHFYSVDELLAKYSDLAKSSLLLSDFELMDGNLDGINLILRLHHSQNSILVTARNEESVIQHRCLENGIHLLSKNLVNYVTIKNDEHTNEIVISQNDHKTSIILIDDDKFIHVNWSMYCQRNNLKFIGFKSVSAFLSSCSTIDRDSKIFIDSNLGNGVKGEFEAEKLFQKGFVNLYLATGYEKDSFLKPRWIKDIFSKNPSDFFKVDCL